MRRDEFIGAFYRLKNALKDSQLDKLLSLGRSQRDASSKVLSAVLGSYAKFMTHYARFTELEKKLMEAFQLTPIIDPEFWYEYVGSSESKGPMAAAVHARWGTILISEYIPPIIGLLEQTKEVEPIIVTEGSKKGKQKSVAMQKVTFLIRESDTPNLSVEQFSSVLNAIQNLYNVILKIDNLGHADLVVGALDSGSDKSIDIIGVAAAIAKLSDLLLQSWDRIRFGQSTKMSASIKTASDGLTLLTQIASAVTAGTLSATEGEKLRRTVVKSVDELFSNGVYTEEMEGNVPIPPSQLPVERRKLIAHRVTPDPAAGATKAKEIDDNGPEPEED